MAEQLEDEKPKSRNEALIKVIKPRQGSYELDFPFTPASSIDDAHTTAELVHYAEGDKNIDIEARILCLTKDGLKHRKLNKDQFIESFKSKRTEEVNFHESFDDWQGNAQFGNGLVGDDYIPLLGGPFNKQLYMTDYLRQHAAAFQASTHDPVAKRSIQIIRQFVLGKGYRIDVTGGKDAELGLGVIRASEKQNKFQELMYYICTEISTYGEVMIWKLPNHQTKVEWQLRPEQQAPKALLPRYRLIDPSTCWEIITYPEDITRVLSYKLIYPTQYQIYTDGIQPTLKFIVQDVPGDQVGHFKVNVVSNEKRGRSDLFPILGYLKRLRDSVNYQIIADQKNSAWAIDTTVEGTVDDMNAYIDDQNSNGTIAPAGSEFVHTSKIKREYLANSGAGHGNSNSFDWTMNMIAAGQGIPVSYYGMHIGGASTRASALVGTEPVAKFFEERQQLMEQILRFMVDDTIEQMGLDVEYEITWPEIITQDRSAKLKDLTLCEQSGWFSKERAASIAAKEMGVTEFEFQAEQHDIKDQKSLDANADLITPLTMGPAGSGSTPSTGGGDNGQLDRPSAVTQADRRNVAMNR